MFFQLHHVEVADRVDQPYARSQPIKAAFAPQHAAGSRVEWPHDRHLGRHGLQPVHDRGQALRMVGVLGTMNSGQHIAARFDT